MKTIRKTRESFYTYEVGCGNCHKSNLIYIKKGKLVIDALRENAFLTDVSGKSPKTGPDCFNCNMDLRNNFKNPWTEPGKWGVSL